MLVTTNLTRSRDAPYISTLPLDVALFAVEKPIPLLQELEKTKINKICTKSFFTTAGFFPVGCTDCKHSDDTFMENVSECIDFELNYRDMFWVSH